MLDSFSDLKRIHQIHQTGWESVAREIFQIRSSFLNAIYI